MNNVWRLTRTKASIIEFQVKAVEWQLGFRFYPDEYSFDSTNVYKCTEWPRSENCQAY